jgi:hypothetical protein
MNYLQLCQRTAMECGVSLTGPSAVTGQTGRLGQVVSWVNAAWGDIQTKYDNWNWMVGAFTVNTSSGDGKYAFGDCTDTTTSAAIASFRKWRLDSFKIYLASAGQGTETDLVPISYAEWYQRYNVGAVVSTNSYPRNMAEHPDRSFLLGHKPDGIYTVSGEYMKAAEALAADDDTPDLPAEFHMAIVYRAMMKYGRYNAAPEVFNDGQAEYFRLLREMERTQRPPRLEAGPLA